MYITVCLKDGLGEKQHWQIVATSANKYFQNWVR